MSCIIIDNVTNESGRINSWSTFNDEYNNNLVANFLLGQYHGRSKITREDIHAYHTFYRYLIAEIIGLVVYKLDNYAYNDKDIKDNKKELNKLKNILDIHVSNGNSGSDGSIKEINFSQKVKIYYSSDMKCEKLKPRYGYKVIRENQYIPLEIGYTSYSKSLSQILLNGGLARFPYDNNFDNSAALYVLYMVEKTHKKAMEVNKAIF